MSLAQRTYFLQDVFQMIGIALVWVNNHNHINGLHLFWNTLHINIHPTPAHEQYMTQGQFLAEFSRF